jgi:hypothetical protein
VLEIELVDDAEDRTLELGTVVCVAADEIDSVGDALFDDCAEDVAYAVIEGAADDVSTLVAVTDEIEDAVTKIDDDDDTVCGAEGDTFAVGVVEVDTDTDAVASALSVRTELGETVFVVDVVCSAEWDGDNVPQDDFDVNPVDELDDVGKIVLVFVGIEAFAVPLEDTIVLDDKEDDTDDVDDTEGRGDAETLTDSVGFGDKDDAADCVVDMVR